MQLAQGRILGIHPDERRFVLACALLVLHAMAANVLVLGAVTALFLGAAQRTQLPIVYAAGAAFGGAITLVLGALSARLSRSREISAVFSALAATLVLAFVLLPWLPHGLLFVVHPVAISFAMLAVVQTYAIVNDCLDAEQAKRLLPAIGAGGTLGAMAAGATLASLAPWLGARGMLLLAAAIALVARSLARAFLARQAQRFVSIRPRSTSIRPSDAAALGSSAKQVLRHLLASPLLFRFALGQMAIAVASTALKFELESTLQATLGVNRIAAFLGMLNLCSNAAVLAVQTLLESRLLRAFGITLGLVSTALVLSVGGATLLLTTGLWSVATLRFAENVTRFSVTRTADDLVLLPVASDLRRRARAFIATLVMPSAVLVASLVLALLAQLPSVATHLLMLAAGATGLWLALSLRKPYLERLRDSLKRRRITLDQLARGNHDPTLAALLSTLHTTDASLRVGALRTLARHRMRGAEISASTQDIAREISRETLQGHTLRLIRSALLQANVDALHSRAAERELAYQNDRVDEMLFLLLTLVQPPADMQRAYLAYTRGDRRERAFAVEMVGQSLDNDLRKQITPYLSATTTDEQVARAVRALELTHQLGMHALLVHTALPFKERLRPLALYLGAKPPANPDEEHLMTQLDEVFMLRTVDLFSRLSPEELQSIVEIATHHDFEPEQTVFKEGDPGNSFYVVLRGELRVERNGAQVAALNSGECFGELALLDRGLRTATVIAKTACLVSRIEGDDFRDLIERYPSIAIHMLAILARRNANLLDAR